MTQGTQSTSSDPSNVTQTTGTPPPPSDSAAGDARTATSTNPNGYSDDQLKALSELEQDPSFAALKDQLSQAESLMTSGSFRELEKKFADGSSDAKLSWDEIKYAAVHRDRNSSVAAIALADYLNGHEDVFKAIDKNHDGVVSESEINSYIQSLKQQIYDRKKEVLGNATGTTSSTSSSTGSNGGTAGSTGGTGGTSGTGGTGESGETATEWKFNEADLNVRPFASTATDAGNLLADSLGHVQGEVERLTKLKAQALAAGKPEDAAKIDAQLNKLNMCLQMLTASMQQQQQMMSNIAKMWADMAMNSIRNMK